MRKIIYTAIAATMLATSAPAHAMTYYLVAQWIDTQGRFCRYGNGTILNVGFRLCPLSIQG